MQNVSLVHHWLVSARGGEKVLEQFCLLFPEANIHTLVKSGKIESLGTIIPKHQIETTVLGLIPKGEEIYKLMLPFFPLIIGSHKVKSEFILSSDASLIKGVKADENIPHVCYCHSPPRYIWDLQEDYLSSLNPIKATIFKKITPHLQSFDLEASKSVDYFIANSNFVKERIKRIYGMDSKVIHPPVELSEFEISEESEEFYLIVSALVPYKRIDIAVQAFNKNGKNLIIIGDGSELKYLKSIAGSNIKILGSQPNDVLKEMYKKCKAFIFPGIEDFGITPLEAQASGKPVIAINDGGALETVIDMETGLFFKEQSDESLIEAVEKFEKYEKEFKPENCRRNAERFSPEIFRGEIKIFLKEKYPSIFSNL